MINNALACCAICRINWDYMIMIIGWEWFGQTIVVNLKQRCPKPGPLLPVDDICLARHAISQEEVEKRRRKKKAIEACLPFLIIFLFEHFLFYYKNNIKWIRFLKRWTICYLRFCLFKNFNNLKHNIIQLNIMQHLLFCHKIKNRVV